MLRRCRSYLIVARDSGRRFASEVVKEVTEATTRQAIQKLKPYGVIHPIEVKITSGVPDYAYALRCRNRTTDGWLEAKFLKEWPRKPATPVRLPSLKLRQVLWHERHHAVGGRVATLLQVGRSTYLLLAAPVLRLVFDRRLTALELMLQARVCSTTGFPTIELLEALTQ